MFCRCFVQIAKYRTTSGAGVRGRLILCRGSNLDIVMTSQVYTIQRNITIWVQDHYFQHYNGNVCTSKNSCWAYFLSLYFWVDTVITKHSSCKPSSFLQYNHWDLHYFPSKHNTTKHRREGNDAETYKSSVDESILSQPDHTNKVSEAYPFFFYYSDTNAPSICTKTNWVLHFSRFKVLSYRFNVVLQFSLS